ncbi:hypothetical protein Tco_0823045 [Tanacetum coccineum]|uniref:Uncharacterized protein n=1 Tax=Tanacetum coccineum TaxID=301880 RepID=A0ABQ5AKW6_9ASTR
MNKIGELDERSLVIALRIRISKYHKTIWTTLRSTEDGRRWATEVLDPREFRFPFVRQSLDFAIFRFAIMNISLEEMDLDRWIDGYANNEGKEILQEHWKKAYC